MKGFSGTHLRCDRNHRVIFAELCFSLLPGELLIIAGPNGSGKSTLLKTMAQIIAPSIGYLSWDERRIDIEPEHFYKNMRFIGHKNAVKPSLTVRENLIFHASLPESKLTVDEALSKMGIFDIADLPAQHLSAGQTRRLALARLFVSPAKLWLLDEPVVSLDGKSTELFYSALSSHRSEGGLVVSTTTSLSPIPHTKHINMLDYKASDEDIEDAWV